MDLASQLYAQDPLTRAFFDELDLTSGFDLIQDYKKAEIYPLSKELMCNRKAAVRHCLFEIVKNGSCSQIVILASGKSPLSLELLVREKNPALKVFEVDLSGLRVKEKLYQKLIPDVAHQAKFVEMDITSETLKSALHSSGLNENESVVLVLEGITHYLSKGKFEKILKDFSSKGKKANHAIVEFGPPIDSIAEHIRPIAVKAYATVERRFHAGGMTKFTVEELKSMFQAVGGEVTRHIPMETMEYMRTGSNRFFAGENSGWVELVIAKL